MFYLSLHLFLYFYLFLVRNTFFLFVKLTVWLWAGGWVCHHPVLTGLNWNLYTNENETHTHTHHTQPHTPHTTHTTHTHTPHTHTPHHTHTHNTHHQHTHTHTHTHQHTTHTHNTHHTHQPHTHTPITHHTVPPALLQKQSLHHLINTISAPLYLSDTFLTFRVSFSQSFLKFSLCVFILFVTPPWFISHTSLWNDKKILLKIVSSSRSSQLQKSVKANLPVALFSIFQSLFAIF